MRGDDQALAEAVSKEYRTIMHDAAIALRRVVERIATVLSSASIDQEGAWGDWLRHSATFRANYKDAVTRSTAEKESLERLEDVEKRLSVHKTQTARLEEELKHMGDPGGLYTSERNAWRSAIDERDNIISEQCATLTADSDDTIRARLIRFADCASFSAKLSQVLLGSGLRSAKIDQICSSILQSSDPNGYYSNIIDELESLANFVPLDQGEEARPATPILIRSGLNSNDLAKMASKLTSSDWLDVSLTPIKSQPQFEYRSREGDYIAFQDASSGQQATALLMVLLRQTGAPLIVDQPEEDLDNPVMQKIVETIWNAKTKRQIIFASHNANLVVNGDAELVVWCDYRVSGDQSSGEIAGEGAIDLPEAREAIKRIMEGGEIAFQLRREKYGF